jgi:hypothetical protein
MGVKDIVVIDTPDALLVCALDRVNELKRIVEQLREQQRDDYCEAMMLTDYARIVLRRWWLVVLPLMSLP